MSEDQPDSLEASLDADRYMHFRLTGERFEAPGMPADAMAEVQTIAEALFQIAREQWLADHDGRVRVPEGFADLFDLRLVAIDGGSAKPRLVLRRRPSSYGDSDAEEMFDAMLRAPRVLSEVLTSVRDDRAVPSWLPRKQIPKIAKIGQSLGDDETVEIGPGTNDKDVTAEIVQVDLGVRNTLEAIDRALREVAEPTEEWLEGVVTEFDGARQTFRLNVANGLGIVGCEIASGEFTLAREIKAVLAEDGVTAPDVRVRGWATRDERGRIRELRDVLEVNVTRSIKEKWLLARLELLESLEDGWWEAGSQKPHAGVLDAAREVCLRLGELESAPTLTARTDGSVAFEVLINSLHCVAVIEAEGTQMYLMADDGTEADPEEVEASFNVDRLTHFLSTGSPT